MRCLILSSPVCGLLAIAACTSSPGRSTPAAGPVSARTTTDGPIPPAIEFVVPKAPTVARGDSGAFLVYELHVTNLAPATYALKQVDVLRPGGATGSSFADTALMRMVSRPGSTILPSERLNIAGGSRALLYLWLPFDSTAAPAELLHRLTLQRMRNDTATQKLVADGQPSMLEGAPVPVDARPPRISAPLRGEWLAANGPSNASGHRRTQLALGGVTSIPQRFGIDFLQVDEQGNTFKGDRSKNANFIAYGKEALAVADGIVVQTKDGIPENTGGPLSRAVPVTLETVGGNHVVLEIGPKQYAFYAHLQPGSLRVRVGDRVRRGQVLGLVGNSGNSTEPHLHFHIVDAIAPGTSTLGAEGIPYALTFDLIGRCQFSGTVRCARNAPLEVRDGIPLQNQLVRFRD
jgi:murein DD-endopeptidase